MKTQKAIKQVLTERWYAWENANRVAATDEEVNLSDEGPAYQPKMVMFIGLSQESKLLTQCTGLHRRGI